jgi:hypothetical protein
MSNFEFFSPSSLHEFIKTQFNFLFVIDFHFKPNLKSSLTCYIYKILTCIVVIKLEDGTDADVEAAALDPLNDESVLDLLSLEKLEKMNKQTQTSDYVDSGLN